MFKYIKELFNEWLDGWKIMDEEFEKGNLIFILLPPFTLMPVPKNWLMELGKEGIGLLENSKQSISDFFHEWLDGCKAIDEALDNPEKFIGKAVNNYMARSDALTAWQESYANRVFNFDGTPSRQVGNNFFDVIQNMLQLQTVKHECLYS